MPNQQDIGKKKIIWNNDDPWRQLWVRRICLYIGIFLVVAIILKGAGLDFFSTRCDLLPTDEDNALAFMGSMIQAQAAIIAIVVSLNLVVIQMSASTYTPRMVDVMRKNPDMWVLLFIYIISIIYGFIVLKYIPEGDEPTLVSFGLMLGIYSAIILPVFLYNSIRSLRPDNTISILVNEVNVNNIHNDNWEKVELDIMQPVFDVVHSSINRFDATTAKRGLLELSDRLMILCENSKIDADWVPHIIKHYCDHLTRTSSMVIEKNDELLLEFIIKILKKMERDIDLLWKKRLNHPQLEMGKQNVINPLRSIGVSAAENHFENVTINVVTTLHDIGNHAVENHFEKVAIKVATALQDIGNHAAKNHLENVTIKVATALQDIGNSAAKENRENVTINVATALRVIGNRAAEKHLEKATTKVSDTLIKIGSSTARAGMEDASSKVIISFVEVITLIRKKM